MENSIKIICNGAVPITSFEAIGNLLDWEQVSTTHVSGLNMQIDFQDGKSLTLQANDPGELFRLTSKLHAFKPQWANLNWLKPEMWGQLDRRVTKLNTPVWDTRYFILDSENLTRYNSREQTDKKGSNKITDITTAEFTNDPDDPYIFRVVYKPGDEDTFRAEPGGDAEDWVRKINQVVNQRKAGDDQEKQLSSNSEQKAHTLLFEKWGNYGGRRTTKTRSRRNTPRKSTRTRQRHGRGARNAAYAASCTPTNASSYAKKIMRGSR